LSARDLGRALEVAVAAAREAGDHLRRDFHRPGGARGHHDKAEADTEAEHLIRARLVQAFPSWGYIGEETGRGPAPPAGAPTWLVDPNDGTRDYLEGRRGSAVSIGLVDQGRPVLGVVFAFAYPDDDGDLFAWAEGQGPLLRNGRPVAPVLAAGLGPADVVLVSSTGDRDPEANLVCVEPARFRTVPSIAHRLALVAAGEAAATSALFAPREWDYGAGHALLRSAGGILLDETGAEVRYAEDGTSRTQWTLGGSPAAVALLSRRPWADARGGTWGKDRPVRLARGEAVTDSARLSRAQGALLGLIAGDSLGARGTTSNLLEDRDGMLAGQPGAAGESALALARALVARGTSAPGPGDDRPAEGLGPAEALVSVIPLAIFAHTMAANDAAEMVRRELARTHSDPVLGAAAGALVVAVSQAIASGNGDEVAHRAAVVASARGEGEAALTAAITGALLGSVHGRPAIPAQWRSMVLSCRPHPLRTSRPRPRIYWPTDVLELAERLLLAGAAATQGR